MALAAPDPTRMQSRGYSLEPLQPERWPVALEVLRRNYPKTPAAWWGQGIKRLQDVPPNNDRRPMGMLMHGPRGVAGVTLLFESTRPREGTTQRQVNASSWAIEPADRMHALWMAKNTLCDTGAIYTALTPIPQALRILQRLGFAAVSQQRVLVMALQHARQQSNAPRVLNVSETLQAFKDSPMLQVLQDHDRLGCIVCALELSDRLVPLVLRTRWQSRLIPVAEVIYTPSVADIMSTVVPLSRFLLRHGIFLLEFEAHEDALVDISCTRLFRRRFARGPYQSEGIDHLYSELVYLKN